jgi:hypothetical protein
MTHDQGLAYSPPCQHPAHTPLDTGIRFRIPETGAAMYVKRITVERFLKKPPIMAYPTLTTTSDTWKCFMLHCLRISVCLALASAGVPRNDIIYRLRWNSEVIDFYIRESQQLVATLSAAIVHRTYARGNKPLGRASPL